MYFLLIIILAKTHSSQIQTVCSFYNIEKLIIQNRQDLFLSTKQFKQPNKIKYPLNIMSSTTLQSKSRTIIIHNGSSQASQSHLNEQQSCVNQSNTQEQLERIKQQISLTKDELIDLINKNQFVQKVYCFNNQAKRLIQGGKVQQALIYLNEAEKILQYAASSGKNIQRKSIVEILHNQAACYQTLWDLQKCSNYIQALIFNFNSQLKFNDFSSNYPSQIHMSSSKKSLSTYSVRNQNNKLQKKINLAKYYLLYCAINSQLKNNQGALVSAKKASELTKGVLVEIKSIYQTLKQTNSALQNLPHFVHPMLDQLPKFTQSISVSKVDDLLKIVRHYIKIYNSKCLFNNLSVSKTGSFNQSTQSSKDVYNKYKQFSIGNIMQLQAKGDNSESYKQIEEESSQSISYSKLIQKIIVLSICHFTMATQLRYIALGKAKNDKDVSKTLIQFKQSEAYHLLSILLIGMYMPFDLLYMQHIISSYHTHYQTVLLSNGLDGTPELTEDEIKRIKQTIVFPIKQNNLTSSGSKKQDQMKKCSTTNQSNQSLIVSFNDEEGQDQNSREKIYKKSSHKKDQHESSLIRDQSNSQHNQKYLFDQYYYVKKNTQPDHQNHLAYQDKNMKNQKNQKKSVLKKSKSKSKSQNKNKIKVDKCMKSKITVQENSCIKENNFSKKSSRKSGSKSKHQSLFFNSNPSKIMISTDKQNENENFNSLKSHITSNFGHSPLIMPQIYSKITKKSSSNQQRSKDNAKMKIVNIKKGQNIKHESQYFNKINGISKKVKEENKISTQVVKNKRKSRSTKKKNYFNKNHQDQIKVEYFTVHNQNLLRQNKSPSNKINKKQNRNSVQKFKKQRPSSKSLQKNFSPSVFSKKASNSKFSKINSEFSKQNKNRMTHLSSKSKNSGNSGLNTKRSISGKKSQRQTVNARIQNCHLKTQQSTRTMKTSHFDKYYL